MEQVTASREFPAPLAFPKGVQADHTVGRHRLVLGSEAELGEGLEVSGGEPRWGEVGLGAATVESAGGEDEEEEEGNEAENEEEDGGYEGHYEGF